MSTVQVEVYEAFRSLDVPDDKALRAAVVLGKQVDEVAQLRADMKGEFAAVRSHMDGEFAAVRSHMDGEFAAVRSHVDGEFAAVRAEMAKGFARVDVEFAVVKGEQVVVRWMLGFMLAMQVAILFKLFTR